MTFAMTANLVVALLCVAVLIQSVRMMRSLNTVKDGALTQVVQALDRSTAQARIVLSEMKTLLGTESAANARMLDDARAIREELSMLVGIADAAAERIMSAASAANGHDMGDRLDEFVADVLAKDEIAKDRIAKQEVAA